VLFRLRRIFSYHSTMYADKIERYILDIDSECSYNSENMCHSEIVQTGYRRDIVRMKSKKTCETRRKHIFKNCFICLKTKKRPVKRVQTKYWCKDCKIPHMSSAMFPRLSYVNTF
jgi:hypothetical protein